MKLLKNFFWEMLAEKGAISSKRCIASSGMANMIFLTIHSQLTGKAIDPVIFGMLMTTVLGAAGITAYEKVKDMASKAPMPIELPAAGDAAPIVNEENANA